MRLLYRTTIKVLTTTLRCFTHVLSQSGSLKQFHCAVRRYEKKYNMGDMELQNINPDLTEVSSLLIITSMTF